MEIRLTVALLPLTCLAIDQEVFLSSSKKILTAAPFPKSEPRGYRGQQALVHALPTLRSGGDHAKSTAGGNVEQRVGRGLAKGPHDLSPTAGAVLEWPARTDCTLSLPIVGGQHRRESCT